MTIGRPLGFVWMLGLAFVLAGGAGCHNSRATAQKAVQAEYADRQERAKESTRLTEKAREELEDGDLKDARELLTSAVKADDRNTAAWMLLGKTEFDDNRLYSAAEAFHRAKCLAPSRYEPRYNLGMVYERSARYADAAVEYEAALDLQPDQTEVMENLARTYVLSGQKPERVRELIQKAMTRENRPEWRHWMQMQLLKTSGTAFVSSTIQPATSPASTMPVQSPGGIP